MPCPKCKRNVQCAKACGNGWCLDCCLTDGKKDCARHNYKAPVPDAADAGAAGGGAGGGAGAGAGGDAGAGAGGGDGAGDGKCAGCKEPLQAALDDGCEPKLCGPCCVKKRKACGAKVHRMLLNAVLEASPVRSPLGKKRGRADLEEVQEVSDIDSDDSGPAKKRPDLIRRSGPYATYSLSEPEVLERVLADWAKEHFRSEDRVEVDGVFRDLRAELFSHTADVLHESVFACPPSSGDVHSARVYKFKTGLGVRSAEASVALGMAFRQAALWGDKFIQLLRFMALAQQDVAKTATSFLPIASKTSSTVAACDEVKRLQPARHYPGCSWADEVRLADPNDFITLGLNLITITPSHIRPFADAYLGRITREYEKRNSKALLSPAVWVATYGGRRTEGAALNGSSGSHAGGRGDGGGRGNGSAKERRAKKKERLKERLAELEELKKTQVPSGGGSGGRGGGGRGFSSGAKSGAGGRGGRG